MFDCTGLLWIAFDCVGLYRIVWDCVRLHWIALECVGLRLIVWVVLDSFGLCCIALFSLVLYGLV